MNLIFTETAINSLKKIQKTDQERIILKLEWLISTGDFVSFTKPIMNMKPITHRLRVGNYRILIYFSQNNVFVVNLGHRKDIYKKRF